MSRAGDAGEGRGAHAAIGVERAQRSAGQQGHWAVAIAHLVGGAALARLCNRAAISQAITFASMLQVAFDLYRYEILKQMELNVPTDLAAERALWQRLTRQLLDTPSQMATTSKGPTGIGRDVT